MVLVQEYAKVWTAQNVSPVAFRAAEVALEEWNKQSLWDVSPALFLKTNFFLYATQLIKAALKLMNTCSVMKQQRGAYCHISEAEQEVRDAHFLVAIPTSFLDANTEPGSIFSVAKT